MGTLLFYILLIVIVFAGFIAVQIMARPVWRLCSLTVFVVLCCLSVSRSTKVSTYHEVQDHYVRGGLPDFVADLKKLSIAGRTNEVVHACERFQREFNIWHEGDAVTNFWDLVAETSRAANRTDQPQ